MKNLIFFLVLIFASTNMVMAQKKEQGQRKNIIKFELVSNLIYRNAIILGYERITKPNQSFAISGGYQEFPKVLGLGSNIDVKKNLEKSGFKFGGEYRFYLRKENKFQAPRGVYIGPYFSYHNFSNERTIEVDYNGNPETGNLNTKFGILNLGAQLGYQFVIANRWTIDLIFIGPSVSNYNFKSTVDGSLSVDKEDIQNEVILELIDRFPLLDELITDSEVSSSGKLDSWSFGYRYQFQIGYHFGKKR